MQFDTIKLIAGDSANIFAVGDDDQSIYGFRGSKPDIMLAFEDYYSNAEIINLNVNYRCTDNIVNAARSLIGNNSLRYYKNIKSAGMVGECIQVQGAKDIHSLKKMLSDNIKKLYRKMALNHQILLLYQEPTVLMVYIIPDLLMMEFPAFRRRNRRIYMITGLLGYACIY